MQELTDHINTVLPEIREVRHQLHRWPELAYEEERTAALLAEQLRAIPGMQVRTGIGGTGIVATLGSEKPGPCVALRADIDALPIEEETGLPYASERPGLMHACGHDGHTACLLGAAQVLARVADDPRGPVKFLFQPAEEGGAGADRMIHDGALEDPAPRAIFGLHGWPVLPQHTVGCRRGPLMAGNVNLKIIIRGKDGHAAMPHQTVDPILIGSHMVTALQGVASRFADPLDSVVVSITKFHSGTASNIIPGKAELAGTLRALNDDVRDRMLEHIRRLADSTAAGFGGTAEVHFDDFYPVTYNHADAADYVRHVATETAGNVPEIQASEVPPTMAAEDFAFYGAHIPAAFWFLGLRPPGQDRYPKLHQPDFDFPDAVIPTGIRMHCEIARRFAREYHPAE
jgi:amidohydrolase